MKDDEVQVNGIIYKKAVYPLLKFFKKADCQDEKQATAQTPEEADEILDRLGHG